MTEKLLHDRVGDLRSELTAAINRTVDLDCLIFEYRTPCKSCPEFPPYWLKDRPVYLGLNSFIHQLLQDPSTFRVNESVEAVFRGYQYLGDSADGAQFRKIANIAGRSLVKFQKQDMVKLGLSDATLAIRWPDSRWIMALLDYGINADGQFTERIERWHKFPDQGDCRLNHLPNSTFARYV
ncbi:MAG: hypothetical protein WD065_16940, partial [Planctomycetaceae bacterium]